MFSKIHFLEKNLLKKLKLKVENQKLKVDEIRGDLEDLTEDQESVLNNKTDGLKAIRYSLKNIIRLRIEQLVTHIFSLNVNPTIFQ